MKISIACDHGALALKNLVAEHLRKQGHEVLDFGTHTTDSCDFITDFYCITHCLFFLLSLFLRTNHNKIHDTEHCYEHNNHRC